MSEDRRARMTRELLSAIRLGEDSGIEFKAVHVRGGRPFERSDAIADDLAAMANARGGRIVFGVDDQSRQVSGIPLEQLDRVESALREIARDKVEPLVHLDCWRLDVPDTAGVLRAVLLVEVPRSLFVHRSPGGYRKRYGASQRELRPDELLRLMQQRSQARAVGFDELPVPRTSASDLHPALALRFARDAGDPRAFHKLRLLAADEDGIERLSVASVLLCTEQPQTHFPGAYIQCVQYPSRARADAGQRDAFDATGPLDQQIDAALAWVQRRAPVRAQKTPWRIETPAYDPQALFEAIVNAVVHRDYSIRGSHIRLHLFPDRLELYSPGALANTLTVDALDARQYVRNDLIASLLGRIGVPEVSGLGRRHYLERRGDGVPIIYTRSEALSGRRPEYRLIDDAELLLTLFAADMDPE